ncbi:MAG TPA: hypothetical protein VIE43_01550, partial [Thermoanaerobaculia bacterium]|nr:hypothetical protein [Thermoanaerobaculia bacterium]
CAAYSKFCCNSTKSLGIQIVDTPMAPEAPVNADFAAGGHKINRTLLGLYIHFTAATQRRRSRLINAA